MRGVLAEFEGSNQIDPLRHFDHQGSSSSVLPRMQSASQRMTHTLALVIRLSPVPHRVVSNDRAGPSTPVHCLHTHTKHSQEIVIHSTFYFSVVCDLQSLW